MKTFEEIDIFVTGEESKDNMKKVYNAFIEMIKEVSRRIEQQVDDYGVWMTEYLPDVWPELTKNYGITAYYDEEEDILNICLLWLYMDETGKICQKPLVFVNVTGHSDVSFDIDGAAYILMVAYINHLGVMAIQEEKNSEGS